uniref:O-methyltransferase domain-containing protein n=2 Tax=Setaria viridis TaxID=4556 RepID=A0A4U6VQP9_SETVI|nr:trans-resveratrol di-O-methyltransferase-like [Setaria viridis]TKW31165.1 hypothetical protein SEVIR_2G087000v2 [Setaria viridis]
MAQSPSSMPVLSMATTGAELTQAEAVLWCHGFGYIKSMALQCAIKLGIPNAIHRRGGAASLPELHAAVPVAASKRPCLSRIMTFLAASGIFRQEKITDDGAAACYHLTAASRLLVDDDDAGGRSTCVSQFLTLLSTPHFVTASQNLAEWLQKDGAGTGAAAAERTPFAMAHGAGFYDVIRRDAALGACFDAAMGSDTSFVSEIVVREHGEVFAGVASVVDVGGHNGTTARAIAGAFPHVRCSVLDLPRVVEAMPADGTVEFVAGDMREFIPPADAVLFKYVLHNWSDEDCVQILKRSKEAVCAREPRGKVVITEVVLSGSPSKQTLEAQLLMDLCMMVVLEGKERTEDTWHKIFLDAGFTRYKITPISGTTRSLIEVFP